MTRNEPHTLLISLAIAGALAARADAQLPKKQELLVNGGFESGDTSGWTQVTSSTVLVQQYGVGDSPSKNLGAAIGGGTYVVGDYSGGNAKLRQTIDLSGNIAEVDAGGLWLRLSGAFGGIDSQTDLAALRVTFLDTLGVVLSEGSIGDVTRDERNQETVLLARSGVFAVPVGSRQMLVDLKMTYYTSNADGFADTLSAMLLDDPSVPPLPLNQELLANGDFEAGYIPSSIFTPSIESGWRGTNSSTVRVEAYGLDGIPSIDIASAIHGGSLLVGDYSGGNAELRQRFDLSGNASAIDAGTLFVAMSGAFGGIGSDVDRAWMDAFFYDAAGALLSEHRIGDVTRENRNMETALLKRSGVFPVPPGSRAMNIDLRMVYSSNNADAFADNLSVRLTTDASIPPLPYDAELLTNGNFEAGYLPGSILTPGVESGWFGTNTSTVKVEGYGLSGIPSVELSQQIGGGTYLVGDYSGGNARLRQVFDLRGNANDVDLGVLFIRLAGAFGGISSDVDRAWLEAAFLDDAGATLATYRVGDITRENRNMETSLLRRDGVFPVPAGARDLWIELAMVYSSNNADGFADNLSARLSKNGPAALPLNVNLIDEGGFESGEFLTPSKQRSWIGGNTSTFRVEAYGVDPSVPSLVDAATLQAGQYVLGDFSGGGAKASQTLLLHGMTDLVDDGILGLHVSALLGGTGADADSAQVNVYAYNDLGALLTTETVGPVTKEERGNVTSLLLRKATLPVPIDARRIVIEVKMNFNQGPNADGLADSVAAMLFNAIEGGPAAYAGTSEDLFLFSGEYGALTTGPGFDEKEISEGSAITLKIDSLEGTFDFAPIVLLAGVYPTGAYPGPMFPGVAAPLGSTFLVNGLASGFLGFHLLYPPGNLYQIAIPDGLAGFSIMVQPLVVPFAAPPGYAPATPLNGLFASADAHVLNVKP